MIRFQFFEDNRTEYSVKRMCTVFGLNRSSYYKWKASSAQRHRRLIDDAMLGAKVKAVFDEKDQLCGAKRIAAELTYNDAPRFKRDLEDILERLETQSVTSPLELGSSIMQACKSNPLQHSYFTAVYPS